MQVYNSDEFISSECFFRDQVYLPRGGVMLVLPGLGALVGGLLLVVDFFHSYNSNSDVMRS